MTIPLKPVKPNKNPGDGMPFTGKELTDTPFSIDRLFVWGIGIVMLIGMIGMVIIGYQGREIPPQIQSATMFAIGVFAARIEKRLTE